MSCSQFVFEPPCKEPCRAAAERCAAKLCGGLFVFEGCKRTPNVVAKRKTSRATPHICAPRRRLMRKGSATLAAEVVAAAMAAVAEVQKMVEADKNWNADKRWKWCCVCWSKPIEVRLEPCGHTSLCHSCAQRIHDSISTCPLCRAGIKDIVCAATRKSKMKKRDLTGTFREAPPSVLAGRRMVRRAGSPMLRSHALLAS
jgi:hypothetical protein